MFKVSTSETFPDIEMAIPGRAMSGTHAVPCPSAPSFAGTPCDLDSLGVPTVQGRVPPRIPFFSTPGPVIILAPMAGVTDYPFRQMVRRFGGCTLTISEMIASQAMVRQISKSLQRHRQEDEDFTAVQLAGNDPEVMAEAARMSLDRGACLIDVNMGCPVKKIAINSYAGSALMRDECLAGRIFRALVKAVNGRVPVTVKMRKGWDDQNQNALSLARIAQQEGLAYVTVHGRTRAQLFSGQADWDFIAGVQQNLNMPVIGNGDITTVQDAARVIATTSGVMVGRGCYGRPWFLRQIRTFLETGQDEGAPDLRQRGALVCDHFESMLSYYGKDQGMLLARKHLGWYSKGLPGASDFRVAVFAQDDPVQIRASILQFFQTAADLALPSVDG